MTTTEIIKKRYPFYDEDVYGKDIEINGEAVKELMVEYADSEVKKISFNLPVIGSFTMQDLMLYYSDKKGFDFNSKVIDVLNSMVNDR